MKKWLWVTIGLVLAIILSGTLGYALSQGGDNKFTPVTEEEGQGIAEEFLRDSSTFVFDGIEDTLMLVDAQTALCPNCWEFDFEFQCLHAGYGDRSGQVVAEVITPHTARIIVQEGEVVHAAMDDGWDMMKQEMLAIYSGGAAAETIIVVAGDSFILSLDSNPTTGYAWQAQFDDQVIELMQTNFVPSSDALGAGGIESFEFRALKKGDTEVTMVYKRSWEESYLEKIIFSIHVAES